MRRHQPIYLLTVIGLVAVGSVLFAPAALSQDAQDLALVNDFIRILVNNRDQNMGRFSVETTGGDPERPEDDGQLLIYRRPGQGPSTSYTTVRIDGTDYVFGGPTNERAGDSGRFGRLVERPSIVAGPPRRIDTTFAMGGIEVTQSLSLTRSSTTGLPDTAQITYLLVNADDEPHDVGLRLMLDTMLGSNDGAPFRVGEEAILGDADLAKAETPDFWQAFDSLSDPRVMAQGTTRGDGLTTPDRMFFSNWGAMADGVWDFDYDPGRDFVRLGEFDLDSAIALYWDPEPLAPGERRTYVTQYGLGGLSIVRGNLALGLTAPSQLELGRQDGFPVVAYVQNAGEGEARDVEVTLQLPRGMVLAPGEQARRSLGHLPLGRTSQVSWDVLLDGASGGRFIFAVEATATNLPDPVRAERQIEILAPPAFDIRFSTPQSAEAVADPWRPTLFDLRATIRNTGPRTAENVIAEVTLPPGMQLIGADRGEAVDDPWRAVESLGPGESKEVHWVVALGGYSGNMPIDLEVREEGPSGVRQVETAFVDVFLPPRARLHIDGRGTSESPAGVGEIVRLQAGFQNVQGFGDAVVELRYDPRILRVVQAGSIYQITPGAIFTPDETAGAFRAVEVDNEAGLIRIEATRGTGKAGGFATGVLAEIRFQTLAAGASEIRWESLRLDDPEGRQFPGAERQAAVVHVVP